MKRAMFDAVAVVVVLAVAMVAVAGDGRLAPVNTDADGVALAGHDVVSLYDAGKVEPGDRGITAEHGGATYRFATARNRDAFAADPAKYAPQYGGYCAYGVAKGGLFPVDPATAKVVDGKLYLNKSSEVSKLWQQDIPGHIRQADDNWPRVSAAK